jgi:hypothetical protein
MCGDYRVVLITKGGETGVNGRKVRRLRFAVNVNKTKCAAPGALAGRRIHNPKAGSSSLPPGGLGLLGTAPSEVAMENCDALLIVGSSFPYIEYLPKP